MGSINATYVAQKVSEKLRKGKLVKYGEILLDTGYSESVSRKPKIVTETVAYKKAMLIEQIPLIKGLEEEITRIKEALKAKDLRKEEYRILVGSFDILTKNYQLLSGGATERQVFVLPSEVMNKNLIETIVDKNVKNTNEY